jgi:hypothetical protein
VFLVRLDLAVCNLQLADAYELHIPVQIFVGSRYKMLATKLHIL